VLLSVTEHDKRTIVGVAALIFRAKRAWPDPRLIETIAEQLHSQAE
jgi:hypothetical protein